MVEVVSFAPVVCWTWALRFPGADGSHPIGANCLFCSRDVALPRRYAGREAACLYCAMDRGLIEEVDTLFGEPFDEPGITSDDGGEAVHTDQLRDEPSSIEPVHTGRDGG